MQFVKDTKQQDHQMERGMVQDKSVVNHAQFLSSGKDCGVLVVDID